MYAAEKVNHMGETEARKIVDLGFYWYHKHSKPKEVNVRKQNDIVKSTKTNSNNRPSSTRSTRSSSSSSSEVSIILCPVLSHSSSRSRSQSETSQKSHVRGPSPPKRKKKSSSHRSERRSTRSPPRSRSPKRKDER